MADPTQKEVINALKERSQRSPHKAQRNTGFRGSDYPGLRKLHPGYTGLLCLFLTVLCCQEAAAKSHKPPVFELQHYTPLCLADNLNIEKCAYFTIKIYADGRVHYHGQKAMTLRRFHQAVHILGDRHGKITQSQLIEIVELFESLPFEDEKKYGWLRNNTGGGGIIKYTNKSKQLRFNFFPFFHLITTKLNSFLDIKKWICFPKGHIGHDNCLLVDSTEYPSFEGAPIDPALRTR